MNLATLNNLIKAVANGTFANLCRTGCTSALEAYDAYFTDELTANQRGGSIRLTAVFTPKVVTEENPVLTLQVTSPMRWVCTQAVRAAIAAFRTQAAADLAAIDPGVVIPD